MWASTVTTYVTRLILAGICRTTGRNPLNHEYYALSQAVGPADVGNEADVQAVLRLRLPRRPKTQITAYTVRYKRTARAYRWRYDADAEHARYLERHTQHPYRPDAFGRAV